MNRYEVIGLIEIRKEDIQAFLKEAEALFEKIRKVVSDSRWDTTMTNAKWLKGKSEELLRLLETIEDLKKEIEGYRELEKKILTEEV
ncbi:MAG: hypothetical protein HY754_15785 [Nitrospirae bacterium]|nr:hypothetical protein [Nitrospirota bacterium]